MKKKMSACNISSMSNTILYCLMNVLHTCEFRLPKYRSGEIPSGDVAGAEIGAGEIPMTKISRRVDARLLQNLGYFFAAFRKENHHTRPCVTVRNRHVLHSSKHGSFAECFIQYVDM